MDEVEEVMKVAVGETRHWRVEPKCKKKSGKPQKRDMIYGDRVEKQHWDCHDNGGVVEVDMNVISGKGIRVARVIGISYCSMSDKFDLETGRGIAGKRALAVLRGGTTHQDDPGNI